MPSRHLALAVYLLATVQVCRADVPPPSVAEAEPDQAAVVEMETELEEQRALVHSQQTEMQEWVSLSNRYHDELRNLLMR